MPVAPKVPPSKLIDADSMFGEEVHKPRQSLPSFTKDDLLGMGVRFTESAGTRSLTVPLKTQRYLAETAKPFGFGSPSALEAIISMMLKIFGFEGEVSFRVIEPQFDWNAWQSTGPKIEGGPSPASPPMELTAEPTTSPQTGSSVQFESGAVRDANVAGAKNAKFPARFDLVSPIGLRRLAETYGEGALKYNDHNWRKGMPVSVMLNHAAAHVNAYLTGDASEDHLAHAAWNLFAIMHFEETRPDLFDLKVDDYINAEGR